MSHYEAPVEETLFVLKHVLETDRYQNIDVFSELSDDVVRALLEGAGRFAATALAPLNKSGDREGCVRRPDGSVLTPNGFRDAFKKLVEEGWNNLVAPTDAGGAGLPYVIGAAVEEYMNGANQSFCMYTNWGFYASMLMAGASSTLRDDYLTKLVAGEWCGTMAMTEPHAGTDLGMMRTKAIEQPDGSYRLTGTKIFISGGEHDLTPNIVHFVLARVEGAPSGTRGLSLFLVPKILVNENSALGEANNLACGSVEHKMGLRASATCTMHFDGAKGWLIGEAHRGLAQMFQLMNHTRRLTGVIAIAASEASYQRASAYVKERRQGRALNRSSAGPEGADPLIEQPDVRRELLNIKSFVEAGRALVLYVALQLDLAERSPEAEARKRAGDRIALLTPLAKAVLSDMGYSATIRAQQLFGGHGYMVETGIEQYSRDVRMLPIAEGANGVQAMDLVDRKLKRDGGAILEDFLAEVREAITDLPPALVDLGDAMSRAVSDVAAAANALLESETEDAGYGAYDFMTALGLLALGYMWLRIARVAAEQPDEVPGGSEPRIVRARFFMTHQLTDARACLDRVVASTEELKRLPVEAF